MKSEVCIKAENASSEAEIKQLKALLNAREEALRWYADPQNYGMTSVRLSCGCCSEDLASEAENDGGARARDALKAQIPYPSFARADGYATGVEAAAQLADQYGHSHETWRGFVIAKLIRDKLSPSEGSK